jgi:tRNA threonylcarbamoyladenosine biosynthesis protein TsaE
MNIQVSNVEEMMLFGQQLGHGLEGGEVIELLGDVGAGKTTLAKGIALGMGVDETVQSPSFTVSRTYNARNGLSLDHYDFYRLQDPGIMSHDLDQSIGDHLTVTVIEWADVVKDVLPRDRMQIHIVSPSEETRVLELAPLGEQHRKILEKLQ